MSFLDLPAADGGMKRYSLRGGTSWARPAAPLTSRTVYAAAHVIPEVGADNTPGAPAVLDWDSTLAYRSELWSYGLGVADAMDTAQRGMGLDWAATQELIKRSGAEAAAVAGSGAAATAGKSVRDLLACGAGTDQLDLTALPSGRAGLDVVLEAYREQISVVSGAGAKVILMASRALAAIAEGPEDYLYVYGTLLAEVDQPVVLHWLGTMFDPALAGYWGSTDVARATEVFLGLIMDNASAVDGVKVSLLDASHEVSLRAALPASVRLYTGDDYNYPELIHGDGTHHSDALLGIFAAIYPAASAAIQEYDAGNPDAGRAILDSTRDLGLHIFSAPTFYYKTGVAFLSWINGRQPGFQMVGGLQAGRSILHLSRTFELADAAGLLEDPEEAAHRFGQLLGTYGVGV
ncbi:dihydrodipicolinate synthase family protein [Arthrobacter sp. NamB2]|uniref:dihydrodipicolinate synthase family protein n=1 Tax=Arthrobacter sp. NamB2 TaxID=2576035 RepID=UPI0010C94320|nr:dihydrodipicolinate synthase family protein [Arthrobacter sp. NamB2]TKV28797.1 dihydrodipicolinate synthase family protein [Arthrobacter sp. NamB2]